MGQVGTPQTTPPPAATVQPQVDANFVMSWIDESVAKLNAGDQAGAARAWAEAIRARTKLAAKDPTVEARIKNEEQLLLRKGMRREQIVEAYKSLPAEMRPASRVATASALAPVVTTTNMLPAATGPAVQNTVFAPSTDTTQTRPASGEVVTAPATPPAIPVSTSNVPTGVQLYQNGIKLLSQGNRDGAFKQFQEAWKYQGELDVATRMSLKDKLVSMQPVAPAAAARALPPSINQQELAERQRMMSEVTAEIAAAEANQEAEPEVVRDRLQTLRTRVSQANLDAASRKQMLTIVDRKIASHQIYMTQNRAVIDQQTRNNQILEQRALDQEQRYEIDQQIASLVETYNDLMDKGDFMAAEVVAKQVEAIDRNSQIAKLLMATARNRRRIGEYEEIRNSRQDLFTDAMLDVDRAAETAIRTDNQPLIFNPEIWEDVTRLRQTDVRESEIGMSPAEREIWKQLKQPVLVDFQNRPLSEVARTLSDTSGILMHIDEAGLAREGLTPDMTVSLSLGSEISLQSALNLLLNSRNLGFQVRNEVLVITSARDTAAALKQRTYTVKDLVIPIPNFTTDSNSGMAGALRQAYETIGRGLVARNSGPQPGAGGFVQPASYNMDPNSRVLGQVGGANMLGGGNLPPALPGGFGLGGSSGPTMGSGFGAPPMSMGSPGAIGGGAAQADFDTLINLIQQTIEPDSWLQNGGTNTILPYPSNLSLVVSAPQTTHERITDLLESLRRLQDLQVTIEVKFITLNDNFFERLGVDFDLRIDDNVRNLPLDDQGPSTAVGLNAGFDAASGVLPFTADFDIAVTQDSFGSSVPAFGGFDAAAGASLGFAILSDLEMFFFMNAAQGDQRTNVLQAPRVTMFDGQFASIVDTTSRPFVTSLIPVVGDFAVAQQPVIVILNEGTVLNVQATVSPDKRFVRMTLNPNFSQIDRVDTFTFDGEQTTTTNSTTNGNNVLDPNGNVTGSTNGTTTRTAGTTVQQPSFQNTSINTTVSVPDGGTILLGGIKRMREARLERGVPVLSKIPYLNRLFKNTSIGRETATLMMTVTPRIIIQEEEEMKYGVNP